MSFSLHQISARSPEGICATGWTGSSLGMVSQAWLSRYECRLLVRICLRLRFNGRSRQLLCKDRQRQDRVEQTGTGFGCGSNRTALETLDEVDEAFHGAAPAALGAARAQTQLFRAHHQARRDQQLGQPRAGNGRQGPAPRGRGRSDGVKGQAGKSQAEADPDPALGNECKVCRRMDHMENECAKGSRLGFDSTWCMVHRGRPYETGRPQECDGALDRCFETLLSKDRLDIKLVHTMVFRWIKRYRSCRPEPRCVGVKWHWASCVANYMEENTIVKVDATMLPVRRDEVRERERDRKGGPSRTWDKFDFEDLEKSKTLFQDEFWNTRGDRDELIRRLKEYARSGAARPEVTGVTELRAEPYNGQEFLLEESNLEPTGAGLQDRDEGQSDEIGPGSWSDSQRSAVEAAVLVLQQMMLHGDQGLVPSTSWKGSPVQSRYQAIVALAEYSRRKGAAKLQYPSIHGGTEHSDTMVEDQIDLYRKLREWEGLGHEGHEGCQREDFNIFSSLMESPEMHAYLWSRGDLQFWCGTEIRVSADGKTEKLAGLNKFPDAKHLFYGNGEAILASENEVLDKGSQEAWEFLAKSSLIQWKGDVSLEEYLAKLVIAWKEDSGVGHRWIPEWTRDTRAPPTILRIQYTPESVESWSGFEALATLSFCPPTLPQNRQESLEQRFNLVTVVRLAKTTRDDTYIRVYSSESGKALSPKGLRAGNPAHVNDRWKLGEVGYSYMLYYVQSEKAPTGPPQEVSTHSSVSIGPGGAGPGQSLFSPGQISLGPTRRSQGNLTPKTVGESRVPQLERYWEEDKCAVCDEGLKIEDRTGGLL